VKGSQAESFTPKLDILPYSQRLLWQELDRTPHSFVLYGGTALALRLGHRQSLDFDFFSNEAFDPSELFQSLPYLRDGRVDQRANSTLTVVVERNGPVKVSFFGDLGMNCVQDPDVAAGVQIASLLDLLATKLKTVQQRAEAKDYLDIAAGLETGISLSEILGAAIAIYGSTFNAMTALKALTYFGDGNLPSLSPSTQQRLRAATEAVKLDAVLRPTVRPGMVREDF
jgi:predicted nucleotidyltransferase component of viral defense system